MDSQNSDVVIIREAIKSHDVHKIREMLSKNPEILKYNSASGSPEKPSTLFWEAMTGGTEEVVKLFLEFGANINELHKYYVEDRIYYETFFHWLVYSKVWQSKLKIAETLIRHGADLNISCNQFHPTPLQHAISVNNVQYTEFLLKNGVILGDTESIVSSLTHRLCVCSDEMLLLLLNYGLNVNFRNTLGESILHIVSRLHDEKKCIIKVTEILLNAGISVNGIDSFSHTPLYNAMFFNNNINLISLLIDRGADVNQKIGNEEESLLTIAVKEEKEDLVKLLVSSGADVSAVDDNSRTALHEACSRNLTDLIYFLLRKDAVVSVEDVYDDTPLSLCLENEENNRYQAEDEDEDEDEGMYPLPSQALLEEIARQNFDGHPLCESDREIIQKNPKLKERFEHCLKELSRMKETLFYASHSYYSLTKMSMSMKKFAKLLKNEELEKKFVENFSTFCCYDYILMDIYHAAVRVRDQSFIVEDKLNFVFGDFFPDLIKRKLADNLKIEDLPSE